MMIKEINSAESAEHFEDPVTKYQALINSQKIYQYMYLREYLMICLYNEAESISLQKTQISTSL